MGGAVAAALLVTMAGPVAAAEERAGLLSSEEVLALAREWAAAVDEGSPSGDAAEVDETTETAETAETGAEQAAEPMSGAQVGAVLADVTRSLTQPAQGPDGTVAPGAGGTVVADDLGVRAQFSGHEVPADLAVRVDDLPGAPSARARGPVDPGLPADGVLLVDPFEVVATDAAGHPVTSFPAQFTTLDAATPDDPVLDTDVVPGLRLEVAVDAERVSAADVDRGTVRLFTRESAADPWTEVPSYLDTETSTVLGELDHLSQFVVVGAPNDPDPRPRIVLDPDNDVADVTAPNGAHVTELPYNMQLATGLQNLFSQACHADVVLTRDGGSPTVSRQLRAGIAAAANPALLLTIGFNSFAGGPGGSETGGGSRVYFREDPLSVDAGMRLNSELPGYTGRPSLAITTHAALPYGDYAGLPGAKVHLEALHLNHNYDWPVIEHGFSHLVNGVFTGLGKHLEGQGFNCTDYFGGGWPDRPSAADLARWRLLGHMNYLVYGADPVSFSTGNLFEDEPLFTLPGPGAADTELTLFYNSQDGRPTRVGAGWSFDLGGRAQRFADGSVMVVRGDGASFVYEPDGAGGFAADPGNTSTLREIAGGRLEQADADGTRRVYDTSDLEGIGELVTVTDRAGNSTTLTYGVPDGDDAFLPLTGITDAAGQRIAVTNDGLGRITGFALPDGRTWGLTYDGAGDLAVITGPDGRTRVFTYDAAHRMVTATDPAGVRYLHNEYDGAGRVVAQLDAQDNRRTWTYADTPDDDGLRHVVYTDNEGRPATYWFDAGYRVVRTEDTAGQVEWFTYDGADRVSRFTDGEGRVTRYTYDPAGNVATETGPDGAVTSYTYDAAGEVTSVTDAGGPDGADRTTSWALSPRGLVDTVVFPDGTRSTATYDQAGDVLSETDPEGGTTAYTYDGRGNVVSTTDPTGGVTAFAYDAANRLTAVTDPLGATTTYAWDAGDRLVSQTNPDGGVVSITYDANDHPLTVTDPLGAVTAYTWDEMFRLTSVTDPEGGVTTYAYNTEDALVSRTDPEGGVVTYELDGAYRPVTVRDPNGGAWEITYDATGNVLTETTPEGGTTTSTYDDAGRLETVTDPTGGTTAYAYDAVGRLVAEVDPTGARTTYGYDVMDQVVAVTDPAGETTTYAYDTAGDLTSVTDRRGQTWASEHDPAGRVVAETDPLGARTAYSYDRAGRLTRVEDPLGAVTAYAYDAMGRVVTQTDPLGGETATAYDLAGRVVSETEPLDAVTAYAYDRAGRLTSVTDPTGAVDAYTYDAAGRQTGTTDPIGTRTQYGYDLAGQLVSVVEAGGTDLEAATAYAYDGDGNLTSITDARGGVTSLAYDAAGRVVSETNQVGSVWTTAYDAAGRVERTQDANGLVTRSTYDSRGDLVSTRYADGTTVDLTYDAEGLPIAMTDPTGATAWAYDEAGRLVKQTDGAGQTLEYAYDGAGQVTGLTLPSGDTVASTYDLAGQLVAQHTPWGDLDHTWDAAGRLTATARTEADGAPSVESTFAYDPAGRITTLAHLTPLDPDAPAVTPDPVTPPAPVRRGAAECASADSYLAGRTVPEAGAGVRCQAAADYAKNRALPVPDPVATNGEGIRLDYTYDEASNVTSRTRTTGLVPAATEAMGSGELPGPAAGVGTEYSYDALSRLTGSSSSNGDRATYAYDSTANRTSWSSTVSGETTAWSATYDPAHRLVAADVHRGDAAAHVQYAVDGNGARLSAAATGDPHLSADLQMSATYDAAGRIRSYATADATTTYSRDGLGRAVGSATETATGAVAESWTFDGLTAVAGRSGAASIAIVRDQLGTLALESDERLAGTVDGATRWGLVDALGSVIAQASGTGGVTSITQMMEYGDVGAGTPGTPGWGSDVGYSGADMDLATGTVNYHQRLFDPGTGTWTSRDAWRGLLAVPATLNRFDFLTGNPTSQIDVLGFAGMLIDGMWGSTRAFTAAKKAQSPQPPQPPQPPRNTGGGGSADRCSYAGGYTGCGNSGGTYASSQGAPDTRGPSGRTSATHGGVTLTWRSISDRFRGVWDWTGRWSRSGAGQLTSTILGWVSAGTGAVGAGLALTGVGAPWAVGLGLVSLGTGIASTAITCRARVGASCVIGIAGLALGGLGSVARIGQGVLKLTDDSVQSADILGSFLDSFLGFTGGGMDWVSDRLKFTL
jgi:RHS repeat-associated protein